MAFNKELAILKAFRGEDDPCAILEAAFDTHLAAIIEFRSLLKESDKECFDKAWNEYYYHDGDERMPPFLEQYSKNRGSTGLAEENRKLAIQRIEKILSFARF